MILAIRAILIHASDGLDFSQLHDLPDASANPNFAQEFSTYTTEEEWSQFIASSVSLRHIQVKNQQELVYTSQSIKLLSVKNICHSCFPVHVCAS